MHRLRAAQRISFCSICAINGKGFSSKMRICCVTGKVSCISCPSGTVVTINMIGTLLKVCANMHHCDGHFLQRCIFLKKCTIVMDTLCKDASFCKDASLRWTLFGNTLIHRDAGGQHILLPVSLLHQPEDLGSRWNGPVPMDPCPVASAVHQLHMPVKSRIGMPRLCKRFAAQQCSRQQHFCHAALHGLPLEKHMPTISDGSGGYSEP